MVGSISSANTPGTLAYAFLTAPMADQLPKIEKPLVLVAADDESSRKAIWPALEQSGLRLIPATDAAAALDLFSKMQPDAILIDAESHRIDG